MRAKATLSQKFIACVVDAKGRFNSYDTNLTYGLAAATLIELQNAGSIEVWEKYAKTIAPCPQGKPWLSTAYDVLANPLNEASIAEMFRKLYVPVFSDKRTWPTLENYFSSMEKNGWGRLTHSAMFLRPLFIPNPVFLESICGEVRGQFEEKSPHNAEIATLITILHRSHRLKSIAPGISSREAKRILEKFERVEEEPFRSIMRDNRNTIASLSFATSFLGGGMF